VEKGIGLLKGVVTEIHTNPEDWTEKKHVGINHMKNFNYDKHNW